MAEPTFSIILPTYRHGRLLVNAIASILRQSRQDFEVLLICDGAINEGVAIARKKAREDARFTVFEHPKGPGHGELYRDEAIRQARGSIICYLADDDFWLSEHLQVMEDALRDNDLAYSTRFRLAHNGYFNIGGDLDTDRLDSPDYRARCLETPNLARVAQLSSTAHRLESYLALAEGWTPRRPNIVSYASMWVKFVAHEHIRIKPIARVTSVVLPSKLRRTTFKKGARRKLRSVETVTWMKVLKSRFLQEALDHCCSISKPIAPCEITLRNMNEAYLRNNPPTLAVDAHMADAARIYAEAASSAWNRLRYFAAMQRLKWHRMGPNAVSLAE